MNSTKLKATAVTVHQHLRHTPTGKAVLVRQHQRTEHERKRTEDFLQAWDYYESIGRNELAREVFRLTREDVERWAHKVPASIIPGSSTGEAWLAGFKSGYTGVTFYPDVAGGGLASKAAQGWKAGIEHRAEELYPGSDSESLQARKNYIANRLRGMTESEAQK